MNRVRWRACFLLVFLSFLASAFADGSKDLYPAGVQGNRAFMMSKGENGQATTSFPFPTPGTHFVYVRMGETIAAASSAQNIYEGRIRVTSPSGKTYTSAADNTGRIMDKGQGTRRAELDGPDVGYTPYKVAVDEEGVWKVEFFSPLGANNDMDNGSLLPDVAASVDWEQPDGMYIAAWDVSVRNIENTAWLTGRVYTNVLNLYINSGRLSNADGAFYGKNYVMTDDGYVYRVDGNGSNGIAFTSFVNNKGFPGANGQSVYKSLNYVPAAGSSDVIDPRAADVNGKVTHKMMYTLPDMSMPAEAPAAVPGKKTWLVRHRITAQVSDINVTGVEGNADHVSSKGAWVQFKTNLAGNYKITISSIDSDHSFPDAQFIFTAKQGINNAYWNGRDLSGNLVPAGDKYPVKIKVELLGGEVHFPYIDMEINPQGIILELLSEDLQTVESDIVYWDDSNVSEGMPSENSDPRVNLEGISSRINGHRWGTYSNATVNRNNNQNYGNFSFGNEKAMDTWAYALNIAEIKTQDITVKVADLEVVSVETSSNQVELGENFTYVVTVRNNGPSAVDKAPFHFTLPEGVIIQQVNPVSGAGTISGSLFHNNHYAAYFTLADKEEIVLSFTVRADIVPDATYGYIPVKATIMRKPDMTDPDATSTDILKLLPNTAEEECANNGKGGACNNIMINNQVFLLEPLNERGKLALLKTAVFTDENKDSYMQVGETIQYTLQVENVGYVPVKDIKIQDPLIRSAEIMLAPAVLAAGAKSSVTLSYTITQEDFEKGVITNTANVSGKNPRGFDVKDISGSTVDDDEPTVTVIDRIPEVYLRKRITNKGSGIGGLFVEGDQLEYTFTVWNKSGFAIYDLQLEDPMLFTTATSVSSVALGANDSVQYVARYQLLPADFDKGKVSNSALLFAKESKKGRVVKDISGTEYNNDSATEITIAKRPVAVADSYTLKQNRKLQMEVLKNDIIERTHVNVSSVRITTAPEYGTISIEKDGTISYVPQHNYFGPDEFYYVFSDGYKLESYPGKVNIEVVKTVPVAISDTVNVRYNTTMIIPVLKNDKPEEYAPLDPMSIQIVSLPQYGKVVVNNGKVSYTPQLNFTGKDQFGYQVLDANGNWTNIATVDIMTYGFFVPNVFTPNGDGKNDEFEVIGTGYYDRIEVQIYNRYGKIVYENDNYKNDWNAEGCLDQTYFYTVTAHKSGEESKHKTGYVLIARRLAP
ncbi:MULTISPECIES: Ig-like domain-containing protein [unclassified Sphingobacterium]|uniref:DUF7507 domain-containing protein n=1 Tax=unclassified Sphingobacterium TaxID=2609468 RepID=UPI0025E86995|nr:MULTISPECIES: Ig-like domain-containing protein [unclassified Sphingobacterium]